MQTQIVERTIYAEKCQKCGRKFEGRTVREARNYLNRHELLGHKLSELTKTQEENAE